MKELMMIGICSLVWGCCSFSNALSKSAVAPIAEKIIELKQDFTPLVKDEMADLWVPIPMELKGYQVVVSQKFTGNADSIEVEKVGSVTGSVTMLHATWKKAVNPELHVVSILKIAEYRGLSPNNSPENDPANIAPYLKATEHIQTDGIVSETAKKIVGKIKDPDQKALAIYNWIVENSTRDPQVRGCGLGDVKATLTVNNLSGKCADLNSLFVGLARAAKIPAREVFGIRVNTSTEFPSLGKLGEVTKGQHCRAEYYSTKQKAWIPVDPADVRKAILEEKLALDDPKIKILRAKFFGYWEGNWAVFNFGRDFKIPNKDSFISVNYFMYPLLTSPSLSPDGKDPKEVSYTITSNVLTAKAN